MLKLPTNKKKNYKPVSTANSKNNKKQKKNGRFVKQSSSSPSPASEKLHAERKILNINDDDDDDNVQFLPRVPGGNGRIQFLLIFVSFCYDFLNAERTASARSTSWPAWRRCFWTRRRKSLWSGAKCWGSKRAASAGTITSTATIKCHVFVETKRLRRKESGDISSNCSCF